MSTLTLMRVYVRYHNMPRLPLPWYAGTSYPTPLIDFQRNLLRDGMGRVSANPEYISKSSILKKKGSMGAYNFRRYSTSTEDIKTAEKARLDKKKFKLQTQQTIKIMVVSETGSLDTMTLEEANKLAKKKGVNLVHITNPTEKPVRTEKEIYKLVSKLETLAKEGFEYTKNQKQIDLKSVLLKSNIGDHDALSKINNMKKWIKKGHRVRVAIASAGDKGNAEAIFKNIETAMAEVEGQIQQKISKGNEIRFYIGPPKQLKNNTKSSSTKAKDAKTDSNEEADSESDDDDDTEKEKNIDESRKAQAS